MGVLWILISILILICIIGYNWKRRHLYVAALQYEGPFALPIIGNALEFYCKNDEILMKVQNKVSSYNNPIRFWLGPELVLAFSKPEHVEKILTSSRFSYKHELYDFLKPVIGEGLVSGSGPRYKSHRRIIQPMINLKWCSEISNTVQKHIDICMTKLEKFVDKGTFDIERVLHLCFSDIVSDIILGFPMNSQNGDNLEYIEAYTKIYECSFSKIVKPWLRFDLLFNLTEMGRHFQRSVELCRDLIEKAKIFHEKRKSSPDSAHIKDFIPIMDQISNHIAENPDSINEEDFISHMATLYTASEDTLSAISSLICVCLGMYPEYQEKAYREILSIFPGDDNTNTFTIESLNRLTYLDRCVKDVIRLAPIAPHLLRRVLDDDQIDGKWNLPKGSAIFISTYKLHHDQNEWEKPLHFHPDHFLPEAVKKRHVFTYLPFSAGNRNCIGKIIANISLKLMMCNLLKKFEFRADGKMPDLKLKTDISVRPIDGYKVRMKLRSKNVNT